MKKQTALFIALLLTLIALLGLSSSFKLFHRPKVGDVIDSLNSVAVYYNGKVGNSFGRNSTSDGYNLGLKYQCVEFVKRYYYNHLKHIMPDSYGNAKDFFDSSIEDGTLNKKRNLIQYSNPGKSKPSVDDILIFDGTIFNQYGHVAIIAIVEENRVQIIQQNPGPFGNSRRWMKISFKNNLWQFKDRKVLGWLRKK